MLAHVLLVVMENDQDKIGKIIFDLGEYYGVKITEMDLVIYPWGLSEENFFLTFEADNQSKLMDFLEAVGRQPSVQKVKPYVVTGLNITVEQPQVQNARPGQSQSFPPGF